MRQANVDTILSTIKAANKHDYAQVKQKITIDTININDKTKFVTLQNADASLAHQTLKIDTSNKRKIFKCGGKILTPLLTIFFAYNRENCAFAVCFEQLEDCDQRHTHLNYRR